MKDRILPLLILALLAVACGEAKAPDESDAPAPPVIAATGPIDARLDGARIALTHEEWYAPSPHRISSLTGRVVDESGRVLPGAVVTVLLPPPVAVAPARERPSVTAGEDGVFTIDDVPQNAWVRVSHNEERTLQVRVQELQVMGTDPVDIKLPPGGVIRGTVVDADGSPIPRVGVMATNEGPQFAGTAETDEEGRFRFTGVPSGIVTLWALSETHSGKPVNLLVLAGETVACEIRVDLPVPLNLQVVDAESGRPLAGVVATTLFLRENDITADENGRLRIDKPCFPRVWLRGRGYLALPFDIPMDRTEELTETIPMIRGATVRGRVVDEDGKPLADARVRLLSPADSTAIPTRGPLTPADGTFEVSWLFGREEATSVVAFADLPGYHLKSPGKGQVRLGQALDDVEVVLAKNQSLVLRVVRPNGRPVVGALVGLRGAEPIRAGSFISFNSSSSGRTGPDGIVVLRGMAAQRMSITIRTRDRVPFFEIRDIGPAPRPETPGATPSLDLGEIQLAAGLTVSGRVRSTGERVPEGTVVHVASGDVDEAVAVQADGTFRCSGLPEGRLNLRIKAPGHEMLMVSADAGREDLDLVITAYSSLELTLKRPNDMSIKGWLELKPLSGKVANRGALGRPIDGPMDGYRFGKLVAGRYRVVVRTEDMFARAIVTLGHGEAVVVDLSLARGAVISGTLTQPDGTVSASTGVSLDFGGDWGGLSRVTDEAGKFEFRGIPAGPVTLRTHPTGYAATTRAVEAKVGDDQIVNLTLRSGGSIEVTLRDGSDQPAAGVRVSLSHPDGSPARYWVDGGGRPRTSAAGTVTLTGIEPGEYRLSLFRNGSPVPWGKVLVEEGKAVRVAADWK